MSVEEKLNSIRRNSIIKNITGNLGRVVEEDDRLLCFIDSKKFIYTKNGYLMKCYGIPKEKESFYESYNLNKPVYYIFDNLGLRYPTFIYGYNNCHVVFNSCKFLDDITISIQGSCYLDSPSFVFTQDINFNAFDLTIKNMSDKVHGPKDWSRNIEFIASKNLNIIDSSIGQDAEETYLMSKNINIVNSIINGRVITCEGDKLNVDSTSSIIATNILDIKVEEDSNVNVFSPSIMINGKCYPGVKILEKIDKNR